MEAGKERLIRDTVRDTTRSEVNELLQWQKLARDFFNSHPVVKVGKKKVEPSVGHSGERL